MDKSIISAPPETKSSKSMRRMRNWLLMPRFQIRMGIYGVLLGGAFGAGTTFLLIKKFEKTYRVILELTDAKEEVSQILLRDFRAVALQVGFLLALYVIVNIGISVYVTHQMVGPTFAFRRHIRNLIQGNFGTRVRLRKGDAFSEVAADLNELAIQLEHAGEVKAAKKGSVGG